MKTYGLIGWPLGYSWSPKYFAEKFTREKINATYHSFPLEKIELFPEFLATHPALSGLNVTIPYKTAILPFLDELSEEASQIGAVNTIQFKGGKLIGHNTDAFGFEKTLDGFNQNQIKGALILGSGGATKAVVYVLKKSQIPYQIVSREAANGLAYTALNQGVVAKHNLIINCTPVGTFPDVDERPPFDVSLFNAQTMLIDLVYNPEQTSLMAAAASRGAQTTNGLKMLHFQAERAWQVWSA